MSAMLPPHLERIGSELVTAAHARAPQARARTSPRRRLALLATAVTLAATGTALAITGTNPLEWFRGGDPAREGRFTADPARRVVGEFPSQIACRGDDSALTCRATAPPQVCEETRRADGVTVTECTGRATPCRTRRASGAIVADCAARPGERSYSLVNRIEERPTIDAALVRRVLTPRRDEILFPGDDTPAPLRGITGRRVIELADQRSPDFWRALNLVVSNQGGRISSGGSAPGQELVPPPGVRRFATCELPDAAALRCAAIVNGASLPIGAPVYSLDPDDDWISVPTPTSEQQGAEYQAIWRAMLGRDLTQDEAIVATGLFALPTTSPGSGPPPEERTEVAPTP